MDETTTQKVTAVFQVQSKTDRGYGVEVTLSPPYAIDSQKGAPFDPATHAERWERVNEGWSQATPSGELRMLITNPPAADAFVPGEYYLLTFERYAG